MNVLVDNCCPPLFATTLHGFISHDGHRAFHIKDVPGLPKGRSTSDVDWIAHLRRSSETWIFISGDGRLLRNQAERAALRSSGLHGFVIAPAYHKSPFNHSAAMLIWKWPEIEQVTKLIAPPAMHEIPINKNTRLRQLPL